MALSLRKAPDWSGLAADGFGVRVEGRSCSWALCVEGQEQESGGELVGLMHGGCLAEGLHRCLWLDHLPVLNPARP